ncbi:molecular chaperone GrpE [Parabacteroides sp. PFB2-10]|uniref:nucleotide exchange factor GrpE n=1 Tax=Parabacteroides sp. PFB2-10 TaxID=1742405 RepID=UPI0024755DB5|nr:nucleotide exchange factor GrpE [Parabacteroides sp. PFB2-10]MDH6313808.1 molecular chaperone GrpE [Parabacteroides sp. PFB2-10]MDL2245341.1 nucleotide exchange factor GrpE [Parabacteroides sp. OttesenSCG-928-J18]
MNKVNEERKRVSEDDPINECATNLQEEAPISSDETGENADNVADGCETLQKKYDELNDSHLRLMAEFDNYRKRTLREKADLIKTGGETTLTNLLPVIDDFERALQTIRVAEDVKAVSEGVELIYTKFMAYLAQQGVRPIEAIGKTFDTEAFEAIATIPAPEEDLKGKVLDCVQTGYTLNDKVIRHSKVVVGE